jgi:hypothetical protein
MVAIENLRGYIVNWLRPSHFPTTDEMLAAMAQAPGC